ncbi:ABC transporter ATP-binding protein [Gryllotalpicola reticulitermitis]|uniref:ABC transporter ATP-binding protein n=1 Tax=Gryllotalpicola reticulitermitis TaxID=1184153 RepID=A0ABV8Q606_9MICO
MPVLEVEHLSVTFGSGPDAVKAVEDVSFELAPGQTLALVGESGSGKSVTALAIMRLLPQHNSTVTGSIVFDGKDVLKLRRGELQKVRGNRIAMIYQDPMTALNPSMTVGAQIIETMRSHGIGTRADRRERAAELLAQVGLPDARARVDAYPHQLSGGMRQRVMIAMALACEPDIILADEITTALDVTVQAQILELLAHLSKERGVAVIFITHNLAVVARIGDVVQVMYAGQVVERASTSELLNHPMVPYTVGLLGSTPRLDEDRSDRLSTIPGEPPNPRRRPPGCRFATRCRFHRELCDAELPPLVQAAEADVPHEVRCWGLVPGDGTGWLIEEKAGELA